MDELSPFKERITRVGYTQIQKNDQNIDRASVIYNTKNTVEGKSIDSSITAFRVDKDDETISQIQIREPNHRRRRSAYHKLLSAGKHAEVKQLVTEEINADNEDAVTIYARAKLAEKEKNYE